jgi:hypothetical protein
MGGNFYEAGGSTRPLDGAMRAPGLWAADGRSGAGGGVAGAIGRTGAAGPVTTSKSPSELGRDMTDLLGWRPPLGDISGRGLPKAQKPPRVGGFGWVTLMRA